MIIPIWYLAIWASSALAYLAVCVAILRTRTLGTWPSVFAISADRVIFFIVGRALQHNYPAYAHYYTIDSVLIDLWHVWLAVDLARAIPAGRWFPVAVKRNTLVATLVVGAIAAVITTPANLPVDVRFHRLLNSAAGTTFWCMAIVLLLAIAANGIGFTRTAFRITCAALVRQLSSLIASTVVSHKVSRTTVRATNTTDTIISLLVASVWAFSIARSYREEERFKAEWGTLAEESGILK